MLTTDRWIPSDNLTSERDDERTAVWSLFGVLTVMNTDLAAQSARTTLLAERLAARVGLERDLDLTAAFMLHDIGTLEVPSAILSKAGPLTDEERDVVGRHARVSADMLEQIFGPSDAVRIVLHHHERWDGTGYPARLRGNEIPLGVRILAVADTFVALTTRRPHRAARTPEEALRIVQSEAGGQLDPHIVAELVALAADDTRLLRAPRQPDPPQEIACLSTRASSLSGSQLQALFAVALGLDPREAARRCGRSTGTQRNWVSSVRRSLGCPTRRPLPKLLSSVGRDYYRSAAQL